MILVTVGTTGPFDELLEEVDRLAGEKFFGEDVLCQSGQSKYRMRHCEQFVGRPSIADLIAESSFVISHGGLTVIELLRARKLFVAFANPRLAGDHQTSFLQEMARVADVSWSRNVADLPRLYRERRAAGPAEVKEDLPRAGEVLRALGEVPARKPALLITLSGGGFTSETKHLLAAIRSDFAFRYLAGPWGGQPGTDGIPEGPCRAVPAFGSFMRPSLRQSAYAFLMTFRAACSELRKARIDLVVGVGSSHAVPLLLAGRLLRKKTVFIESLARVQRLSWTGALVYHLRLARTFLVQWPALQERYPRSRVGSVLGSSPPPERGRPRAAGG